MVFRSPCEDAYGGADHLRLKRNILLFPIAKGLAWSIVKPTSYKHYEIPQETLELMKYQKKHRDISLYFVAPHKSMSETLIIPYAISWHGGDIPFIMMGNNLVKSESGWKERTLKYILDRTGVVTVERETNPRSASPIIVSNIEQILLADRNILIFAEGTRSKDGLIHDFKSAGFQGLVQAVSKGQTSYIVPIDVSYSNMIELPQFASYNELASFKCLMFSEPFKYLTESEKLGSLRDLFYFTHYLGEDNYVKLEDMVRSGKADYKSLWKEFEEKYTFKVKDSKDWKVKMGDVDISFGKPLLVENSCDQNYRKELARLSRDSCMNLIKIHKINVLSEAIVRMDPSFGEAIDTRELYQSIIGVVKDLEPHYDKFRHFSPITRPAEIVQTAGIDVDSELLAAYKICANQTRHYLPKSGIEIITR